MGESFKEGAAEATGVNLRHSQVFAQPRTSNVSWARASKRYSKNAVEVAVRLVHSKSFKDKLSIGESSTEKSNDKSEGEFEVDFSGNTTYEPNFGSTVGMNDESATSLFSDETQPRESVDWDAIEGEEGKPSPPVKKAEPPSPAAFKLASSFSTSTDTESTLPPVMNSREIRKDFRGSLLRAGSEQDERIMFSIWDYSGDEKFSLFHPLFLTKLGIYVVVFNMTKLDDPQEMRDLQFWLNTCRMHSPRGPIILVGTHFDKVNNIAEVKEVDNVLRKLLTLKSFVSMKTIIGRTFGRRKTKEKSAYFRNSLAIRQRFGSSLHHRTSSLSGQTNSLSRGKARSTSRSLSTQKVSLRLSRQNFIKQRRISSKVGLMNRKSTSKEARLLYNVVQNKDAQLLFFPVDNKEHDGIEAIRKVIEDCAKTTDLFKEKISLRWLRCLDRMLEISKEEMQRMVLTSGKNASFLSRFKNRGKQASKQSQLVSVSLSGVTRLLLRAPEKEEIDEKNLPNRMTVNIVTMIARRLGITDPYEISQMLKCFNEFGAVVYFGNSNVLSNYVTTNPQWLIQKLNKLILLGSLSPEESKSTPSPRAMGGDRSFDHSELEKVGLIDDFQCFVKNKIASYDLLEYIWGKEDVDFLLSLARSLMLLADWQFADQQIEPTSEPDLSSLMETSTRSLTNLRIRKQALEKIRDELYLVPSLLETKVEGVFSSKTYEKDFTCIFSFSEAFLPKGVFHKLVCLLVEVSQYQNQQLQNKLEKLKHKYQQKGAFGAYRKEILDIEDSVNKTPILHSNFAQIWFNDGYANMFDIAKGVSSEETILSLGASAKSRLQAEGEEEEEEVLEDCVKLAQDGENRIWMFAPKSSPYSPSRNLSRVIAMLHKIEKDVFGASNAFKYFISLESFDGSFVSYEYAARLKIDPWFNNFPEFGQTKAVNVDGLLEM